MSLFTNEVALFNDLDTICRSDLTNIDSVLTPSPALGFTADVHNHLYKNDETNVCHCIVQSMFSQYPERFKRDTLVASRTGDGYFYVPFMPGDTLRHILEIYPHPGQTTQVQHISPTIQVNNIPKRRYEIVWVAIDDLPTYNSSNELVQVQTIEYGVMPPSFVNVDITY